jgi:hypothetical protein
MLKLLFNARLPPWGRRKSSNALACAASLGSKGMPTSARPEAISLTADWTVDCWFSSSRGMLSGSFWSGGSPSWARVSWMSAQAAFSCSTATFSVLFRWSSSDWVAEPRFTRFSIRRWSTSASHRLD